jgi:hypothetical protein
MHGNTSPSTVVPTRVLTAGPAKKSFWNSWGTVKNCHHETEGDTGREEGEIERDRERILEQRKIVECEEESKSVSP